MGAAGMGAAGLGRPGWGRLFLAGEPGPDGRSAGCRHGNSSASDVQGWHEGQLHDPAGCGAAGYAKPCAIMEVRASRGARPRVE
jgi:hypothetical protein